MSYLAAAIQLNGSSNSEANHASVTRLIRRAAGYGASLVCTPENTNYLGPHAEKVRLAEPLDGPTVARYRELAAELGIHLLIGSVNEKSPESHRCYNTSLLIDPNGALVKTYRKIHLFDVNVSPEVCFAESDTVMPGDQVVVAETVLGNIGMSICYDLRFPELYRALVEKGAQLITIPAAFTLTTGKDHWEPLIRARAIETQCYVIAPGQVGEHDDKGLRNSWGHSMLVDPWGHVTGMASDGPGIALAEVDLSKVEQTRRGMPLAAHRKL